MLVLERLNGFPLLAPGCGFTKYAVEMMSCERVCTVNGQAKVLGGPTQMTGQVIARCLQRMSNWVRLTIESLKAEFPAYEILQAFKIFNLRTGTRISSIGSRSECDALQRLAKVFTVDAEQLRDQLNDARNYAVRIFGQQPKDSGSLESWIQALRKMQDRRMVGHHPTDALATVLSRYAAFHGCTTGGVERGLGCLSRVVTKHRTLLDLRSQLGELKLSLDMDNIQQD
eukprot:2826697-Pyramimonas_sp.AAC.1